MLMDFPTARDLAGLMKGVVLGATGKKETTERQTNKIDRVKTVTISEDGETIVERASGRVEHY